MSQVDIFYQIKDRINLVNHISQFENLKIQGNNRFSGNHNHVDSKGQRCLSVNSDMGVWYCFHCGQSGSVIDYEMGRQKIDISSAVDSLIDKYQLHDLLDLNQTDIDKMKTQFDQRKHLHQVLSKSFDFYHQQLRAEDYEYLLDRGLSQEKIEEEKIGFAPGQRSLYRHLRSLNFNDLSLLPTGLFFQTTDGNLSDHYSNCLVFPFRFQGQINYSIGRNCSPNSHPKYVKHLTQSKKYDFVSGDVIQNKIWGIDGLRVGDSVVVVEGIIDALLTKQELDDYTVLSPATNQFSTKQIKELVELISKFEPKSIVFVADNEKSQAGITGALRSVDKVLQSLDQEGDTDWHDRIRITLLPCPPEKDKIDIADYLQQRKVDQVRYWLSSGRTLQQWKQYQEKDPARFFRRTSSGFSPKRLADELCQEGEFYLNVGNQLCHYYQGVYRPNSRKLEFLCQNKLGDLISTNYINETIHYLYRGTSSVPVGANLEAINLQNGIYDLSKRELVCHSPDYLTTVQLPFEYDSAAECDLIENFIHQVVPNDCIELIYQIFAYCLIPNNSYQKSFIFLGQGANGKSTLLDLMLAFLGHQNASKVSLQDLGGNRFRAAELYGRLANIYTDLDNTDLKSTSLFKMITTGDPIMAERKFKDPFEFVPTCKLIFACNQLPKSLDTSSAFYRRLLIIPFPNKFEGNQADRNLLSKLTQPNQLSGLFNKTLKGLEQLRRNGGFEETVSTDLALNQYQRRADSCLWFLQTHCQPIPEEHTAKEDLYQGYQDFCHELDLSLESRQKLNQVVTDYLGPSIQQIRKNVNGKNVRCWQGLRLQ